MVVNESDLGSTGEARSLTKRKIWFR
jgi:hypothetical protein